MNIECEVKMKEKRDANIQSVKAYVASIYELNIWPWASWQLKWKGKQPVTQLVKTKIHTSSPKEVNILLRVELWKEFLTLEFLIVAPGTVTYRLPNTVYS